MGGSDVLEWPLHTSGISYRVCYTSYQYLRVILLGVSVRVRLKRRSIYYIDLGYQDVFYTSHPHFWSGSSQNECSADLYRSRNSFESHFGRKPQTNKLLSGTLTPPASP